jgi:hypothetical protein
LTKKTPKNRSSVNNSHGDVDAEAADADAPLELADAAAEPRACDGFPEDVEYTASWAANKAPGTDHVQAAPQDVCLAQEPFLLSLRAPFVAPNATTRLSIGSVTRLMSAEATEAGYSRRKE